jgi:glycosyltransferase involved in cell wall biosynthesis
MAVRVRYPFLGRRTKGFDIRSKWFTALYDEIRKRIPTEILKLYYLPPSAFAGPLYRLQMAMFERGRAITHIPSQLQSFLLRRRHSAPAVITCYDLSLPSALDRIPLADRVVVPARQVRDALIEAIRLPREPDVIPLAVPAVYRPGDVERGRDVILSVGTEQARKNMEGLFRIFAGVLRSTSATLVKVGARSDARPRLEALARDLGIADHVVWRDSVSEEDLIRLYRTAAVTVVPSFLEGFSMPCLEAMACGCPLVASTMSAIPETVGSGGLLVDPRDEEAWAEAILRVLGDPAEARDLSRRGIERARAFSAERSASQLIRLYEEVWADRGWG